MNQKSLFLLIEQKAKRAGIRVAYINPDTCFCGYPGHKDRIGALNMINASEKEKLKNN